MPVIPGANQSQVLIPGSPANAVSGSEERLMGNAIAGFGESLMQLGKVEKGKRDVIAEAELQNRANSIIEEEKYNTIGATPLPNDPLGQKQIAAFRERVNARVNEFVSESDFDSEVKRGALARIGSDVNSTAASLGAYEFKKIADNNESAKMKLASSYASKVAMSPLKADEYLAEMEILVRRAPKDPARVEAEVIDAQRDVVTGAINELINAQSPDFDAAHAFVDSYGSKFYTNEQRDKVREEINQSDYYFTQRQKSRFEYERTLSVRQMEEEQNNNFNTLSLKREQIGNNEKELASLHNLAIDMRKNNGITEGQLTKILQQPEMSKIKDDMVSYKIIKDYMVKGDSLNGNKAVEKAVNDGDISSKAAASLLKQFKEMEKMSPDAKMAHAAAVRQIRVYRKADFLSGSEAGVISDTKFQNVIATVESEFTVWALKNKDQWPVYKDKANQMVRSKLRLETYVPGAKSQKQFGTPEAAQAEMNRIAKQALADQKSGKKVNKAALDRELKGIKQQLDTLEEARKLKEAQQSVPGGADVKTGEF